MNQISGNLSGAHTKCECHYCTQARWKMSGMAQQEELFRGLQGSPAGAFPYQQWNANGNPVLHTTTDAGPVKSVF